MRCISCGKRANHTVLMLRLRIVGVETHGDQRPVRSVRLRVDDGVDCRSGGRWVTWWWHYSLGLPIVDGGGDGGG
jgi:hypothetical protein